MKTRAYFPHLLILFAALNDGAAYGQDAEIVAPEAPLTQTATAPEPQTPPETRTATAANEASSPYLVSVVATPVAKTGGSAHVIRNRQLERFEYDDPHSVLVLVPGVYSRGEDGMGLRPNIGLRGANPDRSKKVALMEDGILFAPAPYSAPAAYFFPLMTRMPQVRVIKGPSSISYGPQTVGGAIDLVTRAVSSTRSASLDLAGGEHLYGKAHGYFGWGDGTIGFLVEGVHLREDGFKELPDDSSTGFHRNEWMFKSHYALDRNPSTRKELELKLTYSDETSRETYLGLADDDFRREPFRRYDVSKLDQMRWQRTSVVLSHRLRLSKDASIDTAAYRHDFSRIWRKVNGFRGASLFEVLSNPSDPTNQPYYDILTGNSESFTREETLMIGPNDRNFVSQGVETRFRGESSTGPVGHRFEGGLRLHYDRAERRHSEDGFLVLGGDLFPEPTSKTIVTSFNEVWTIATAAHATDALSWGDLTITPGLRLEVLRWTSTNRIDKLTQSQWVHALLPGVGAYYALTRDFGILAGVHRGFSPPAPEVERANAPQVERPSTPEFSVNYEAGTRFSRGVLRAELIGFYNDYSNLTDLCTFSSGCLDENIDRQFDAGRARIYGFEAYAEHELPIGGALKVPFTAVYTLTRTEFLSDFVSEDPIYGNVHEGDQVPYVPRHQAHVSLGLESERASAIFGATYVSPMRERAGDTPLSLKTDEQLVFDAGATLRISKVILLYLNIRNLFDSRDLVSHRPFGARPNAPRWVQLGIRMTSF